MAIHRTAHPALADAESDEQQNMILVRRIVLGDQIRLTLCDSRGMRFSGQMRWKGKEMGQQDEDTGAVRVITLCTDRRSGRHLDATLDSETSVTAD
jgi:hypothetical protein